MTNPEENKTLDKNKKSKEIIIIFAVIIAIITGSIYYINSMKYQTTDDAYVESDLIQIAPRVSGQIKEIYIKDNQKIKEGDLIAKIDDADYKIKLAQAQAMYEKALFSQKVAKAKLDAINTEIKLAKKDLDRYTNLYKAGAVSQQTLDNAKIKYDNTKAKLLSAEESILSNTDNKVVAEALIHPCRYEDGTIDNHFTEFLITKNKKLKDKIEQLGYEITNYVEKDS